MPIKTAVPALDVLPPDLSHDVALASQVLVTQAQEVVDYESLVTVPHLGWQDQQETGGRRQEAGDRLQEAGARGHGHMDPWAGVGVQEKT